MQVNKDLGRDCELSTTGWNATGAALPSWEVARQVLGCIDAAFEPLGAATWKEPGRGWLVASEGLRNWAPNGQCYYADMGHVEACTASVRTPRQLAAQGISTLIVAEAARMRAEAEAPAGTRLALSAANADVLDPGISWGTHLNVSLSPELWENLFVDQRLPGVYGFVLSVMAATIPFFGAGYLLAFKDGTTVFSPSARAHHLTHSQTLATTQPFARGLLNSRREPHGKGAERLHLIGFDFNLISAALLGSVLQCSLAAAEEGFGALVLHSPLRALHSWCFQQDLANGRLDAKATLGDGRSITLAAYVGELASTLLEMCASGLIDPEVAPEAPDLLPRVIALAEQAERGDIESCARHLDWAAKLMTLMDARGSWDGAPARLRDHDFANTDPNRGAFWRLWDAGLVDPLVEREEVAACLEDGPETNRGWARGRLIRRFAAEITSIDWSYVELRRGADRWGPRLRIEMPRTDQPDRARCADHIERATSVAELEALLEVHDEESLGAIDPLLDIRNELAVGVRAGAPAGGDHCATP